MTPRHAFPFNKVSQSISSHRWPHNSCKSSTIIYLLHQWISVDNPRRFTYLSRQRNRLSPSPSRTSLNITKGSLWRTRKTILPQSKSTSSHPNPIQTSHSVPFVEIVSPFFTAKEEERHHHQIHDKAIEQKSRAAIIAYQNSMPDKQFTEINRCIIGKDGKVAHEWEGVWECDDGTVWFLACKHQMTYTAPLFYANPCMMSWINNANVLDPL
jgi:hypothetical protein